MDIFVNHLDSFSLIGPELLLGKIFNETGFNAIEEELFRPDLTTRYFEASEEDELRKTWQASATADRSWFTG